MRRASTAAALGAAAVLAAGYAAARGQASPPQTSRDASAPTSTAEPPKKETPAPVPFYRKYLIAGDPLDEQILEQEKRIRERPDDASLHNDFGNLLARRRFPKEAAEQYELAAKLDKHNFVAYYNLGLLRETEGKRGAAISAYEKSIKRKPGFPPSRFRLGRLFEQEGRDSDAIAQYAQAFRIDPAMRDPHRNPLVIDSELIYRASLENYQRDIATTVEGGDVLYADESRFRAVPVDRAVAADEVEPEPPESAPREVGPATSAPQTGGRHTRPAGETGGSMVGGPQPRPTARTNRMSRPAPAPRTTPVPEVPPPPDVEQPPQAEPGQDQQAPETMPEPTPAPSDDVEPS